MAKQRAYHFAGRNTAVFATSAAAARAKKKRGSDKLVAVRTPQSGETKGGKWSRVRRDGKSPAKSRYGKGRGQGPARKKKRS